MAGRSVTESFQSALGRGNGNRKPRHKRNRNAAWHASKRHTREERQNVMDEIEAQLQIQREAQRKQKEKDSTPVNLPQESSSSAQQETQDDNPNVTCQRSHTLPTLTLLAEICPSKDRRVRMRDAGACRVLRNRLHVASAPHPRPTSFDFTLDLFCKSLLHPSCRTFDVAPTSRSRPLIATLTNQQMILFSSHQQYSHDRHHTSIRHLPLQGSQNTTFMGCLSHGSCPQFDLDVARFTLMGIGDAGRTSSFSEQTLGRQVVPNDFCLCQDSIVMAPTRAKRNGPASLAVIQVSQTRMDLQMRVHRESDLPKSDAFCIDASPEAAAQYGACAIGYRNGQIALWNGIRAQHGSVLTTEHGSKKTTNTFGAVTALSWLSNGNQILARGSFGDCHVYDVRRMGNSSPHNRRTTMDPSLLWELSAPPSCDKVRSKMALYCNGVATDPDEVVAISPLLTENEDPSLGFWSLRTGEWIGQNCLTESMASEACMERPPPFLELCGVTTPCYTMTLQGEFAQQNSNGFGLWFKCGRSVQPADGVSSQAVKFGNIYHMASGSDAN